MATINQIASGQWVSEAATVWDSGLVPAVSDHVVVAGGFSLVVDSDTNALTSFNSSAQTGQLSIGGGAALDVNGSCTLGGNQSAGSGVLACGGSLAVGAGVSGSGLNILMDGTGSVDDQSGAFVFGDIEIDTAGAVTMSSLLTCGDFTMTAGTLVGTSQALTAGGDVLYTSATAVTDLSLTMTGTATLDWSTFADRFLDLTVSSTAVVSLTNDCNTKALHIAGSVSGAQEILISSSGANDYLEITGDAAANVTVAVSSTVDITNAGEVSIGPATLEYRGTVNDVLYTQSGPITASGELWVNNTTALKASTLALGAGSALGDLVLGSKTISGSGIMNLADGSHSVESVAAGHATNAANALAAATSSILMPPAGVLDGADITITSTSARLTNGVLTNVALTGLLNCWGVTESTGNSGDIIHHGGVETGVAIGLAA